MEGLALLGLTIFGAIGALVWRRHREQRLVDTHHGVRCPRYDSQAHVTVRTDPGAQSCRQYLRVTACSLLSDAAVAEVSCPQHCVFILNETAVSAPLPPVACTSGVSDAVELARQTIRNPRISRLLCYYGT